MSPRTPCRGVRGILLISPNVLGCSKESCWPSCWSTGRRLGSPARSSEVFSEYLATRHWQECFPESRKSRWLWTLLQNVFTCKRRDSSRGNQSDTTAVPQVSCVLRRRTDGPRKVIWNLKRREIRS